MDLKPTPQLNIRVQTVVVIVSILLFFLKILAYYLTNSVAVLTDALESTVNVVTGFTGLYSLKVAARPRDENHPYGHGKVELLSAAFEGILILVAGLVIIYESMINLVHSHPISSLDAGMLLIGATAIVNFGLGAYCIKTGKKTHSIALKASGKHLQSDSWTTAGIVLGLLLIRITGITWIDSAAAILFGTLILVEGAKIIRQTIAGITDEADLLLLHDLIELLNSKKRDAWIDLHNLRIIKYGPVLHLDCHLTLPWYYNVNESHQEVELLEQLIAEKHPQPLEMFVHVDACMPPQACSICTMDDCTVRQRAFVQRLDWTFKNVTDNEKHTYKV